MRCFNGCRGGGDKGLERNELVMVSAFKRRETGQCEGYTGIGSSDSELGIAGGLVAVGAILGEDDNSIEFKSFILNKIYSLLWEVVSRSGNQPFEVTGSWVLIRNWPVRLSVDLGGRRSSVLSSTTSCHCGFCLY